MKKMVLTIALGIAACGLMSFSANANSVGEKVECGEHHSAICTTDVHSHSDSEGFGRCLESSCYCKEFKGRGQTCRNCGHAYKRHY